VGNYDQLPNVTFWTKKVKNFPALGRRKDVSILDNKRVILGLGSGRCGTKSLATLLNLQPGVEVSHEDFHSHGRPFRLSYDYNPKNLALAFKALSLRDPPIVGDSAFYWINNVIPLLNHKPDVKCICLKRDKQSVIESYWARNDGSPMDGNLNVGGASFKIQGVAVAGMYMKIASDCGYMKIASDCGPNIDLLKRKTGEVWDEYYLQAERFEKDYPDSFRIYPTEALNEEEKVREMLEFVGIENPIVEVGVWENKRRALLHH